jgi:hypothetical protein
VTAFLPLLKKQVQKKSRIFQECGPKAEIFIPFAGIIQYRFNGFLAVKAAKSQP